jgi:AraC-like DNA-binding protein
MKKILVIEMELGADDYLAKSSMVEELLRTLITGLEKQADFKPWCAIESPKIPTPSLTEAATPTARQSIFPTSPQLKEVFHFIEDNYHKAISLREVAQAVGYSPAYLTDLVRRKTGETVNHWIIKRRMAAAHCLLIETDQSVEQIATAVGYQNAGHFFRQFRQLYGMAPKAWKKMNA